MKRKTNKITNIHLLPGADEQEVRARTRKARRRQATKQMFIRIAVVTAVLALILVLWQNWESVAPEAVLDWADTQFGNGDAGDGYPYNISGSSVIAMGQVKNYLAVLTDSSLQFLNANAGCVEERSNMLSDPMMRTAGRYVLVTEIGGSRFRLETRRETVLDMELENRTIFAADVVASGTTAFVTDAASQSHISTLWVYNSHGKELYRFNSGKYLISSLSLSPDGRSLAAIGTSSEGGALKSALLTFKFTDDTPTEYTALDHMLYDVTHLGSVVLAAGEDEYWLLDGDDLQKTSYNGMELIGYVDSEEAVGLIMKQSGSTDSGRAQLFDKRGNLVKSYPFVGTFRQASCRDDELLVLTDSTAFVIGGKESELQINTPTDTMMATYYRNAVMLQTLNELQQIDR